MDKTTFDRIIKTGMPVTSSEAQAIMAERELARRGSKFLSDFLNHVPHDNRFIKGPIAVIYVGSSNGEYALFSDGGMLETVQVPGEQDQSKIYLIPEDISVAYKQLETKS